MDRESGNNSGKGRGRGRGKNKAKNSGNTEQPQGRGRSRETGNQSNQERQYWPQPTNQPSAGWTNVPERFSNDNEGAVSQQRAWQQQTQQQPRQQQPQPKKQHDVPKTAVALTTALDKLTIDNKEVKATSGSASSPCSTGKKWKISEKKECGTAGRAVRINANYLALIVDKVKECAYHYDIAIEPDKPKRLLKTVFTEFLRLNFPNTAIAFDGQKNAYSPIVLDLTKAIQREIQIVDGETGQERKYLVAIKEVRDSEINLSCLKRYREDMSQLDIPMRAIQCIDIILKDALTNGVQVGRSFFPTHDRAEPLGDFYDFWRGLFQSTILGRIPYVNVDIANKAFPTPMRVVDIVKGLYQQNRNARGNIDSRIDRVVGDQLHKHLRGLRIIYEMPGNQASSKGYKYLQLGEIPENEYFTNSNGTKISVLNHFGERNCRIQYANLPCIQVGNNVKKISLPMEFCRIPPGQAVMKKCTENQTREMIKKAAISTDERRANLLKILQSLQINQSKTVQQFGLRMSTEFPQIDARILDAPTLQYGQAKLIKPTCGAWRAEGIPFIDPANMISWGCLIMDGYTREDAVKGFCNTVLQCAKGCQMSFANCSFITKLRDDRGRYNDRDIDEFLNSQGKSVKVIFCVIPNAGDTYAKVKQSAELRCGALTQCIKAFTMGKKGTDRSTVSNILLKVNAKLAGTNHKLKQSPFLDKCMVIGADVTHPSPDQSTIPSVVGVVSSHDNIAFKYNRSWRLQDPRTEMIKDFKNIISEHLRYYKQENGGRLPEKLLYYRDGVSEGQFQELLSKEVAAMLDACQSQGGTYKPKITVVVVQKRHHTRFFPLPGSRDVGVGKFNNVPPGTIVDKEIVHPNETHFYLVSHQSIQGVARPTKYCVLRDDSKLSMDGLQALTYDLCHMFARCNRTVSYPAPTYYAHLMAARGKAYIECQRINMDKLDMEYQRRLVCNAITANHPMYFI